MSDKDQMVKRLFKVVNHGNTFYTDNKMTAKSVRDLDRASGGHAVVMRGHDHWRGESYGV